MPWRTRCCTPDGSPHLPSSSPSLLGRLSRLAPPCPSPARSSLPSRAFAQGPARFAPRVPRHDASLPPAVAATAAARSLTLALSQPLAEPWLRQQGPPLADAGVG